MSHAGLTIQNESVNVQLRYKRGSRFLPEYETFCRDWPNQAMHPSREVGRFYDGQSLVAAG